MTTFQPVQQGFIDSSIGTSWVSREQSVMFPAERADALHALLLWRVRLWTDLEAAEAAAHRLHAAARDAGVAELPPSASTWTILGAAMVEVETQAAEGKRLVERVAQLRKEVRHDQQSLKAVKCILRSARAIVPLVGEPLFRAGVSHCSGRGEPLRGRGLSG